MPQNESIGFIGIGVMGKSMAGHLLAAGYPVHVFNRTKTKAQPLLEKGGQWQDSIAAVARQANVVITIVGFPHDVESVYLGADGIVAAARPGSLLIDMTTSSPDLAVRIAEQAKKRSLASLDAPVSGGDIGAREARLSIMVGGDEAAYQRALPIFEKMGKNIALQGGPGAGQHTKMSNQIAIASGMVAICEAMSYAKESGLDPAKVLKSIETGAAGSWSLSNLAPRMLQGNFAPGFFVKHFLKDMKIALESAERMKLDLPGLTLAKKLYDKLAAQGGENDGTQALFKLYEAGLTR